MDKAARTGIRIADLLDKEEFREKLDRNLKEKNRLLERFMKQKDLNSKMYLKSITSTVSLYQNT